MLKADSIMTDQMVSVGPETTIGQAIQQILDENTGILLVSGTDDRLVGVIPGSVLLRAAVDSHIRFDPVSVHMTRQFMSVDAAAPLETVVDQFMLHRLNYLPVLKNERLVGIINRIDVLRASFGCSSPAAAEAIS